MIIKSIWILGNNVRVSIDSYVGWNMCNRSDESEHCIVSVHTFVLFVCYFPLSLHLGGTAVNNLYDESAYYDGLVQMTGEH